RLHLRYEGGLTRIAGGDENVADEAVTPDALDRRAGKKRAKRRIVEPEEVREPWLLQVLPRHELGLGCRVGELVPRADGEAVVATIDAVSHGGAEFARDRPLMLDGQVGDAAPRIELIGCRKSVRRADVEAGAA